MPGHAWRLRHRGGGHEVPPYRICRCEFVVLWRSCLWRSIFSFKMLSLPLLPLLYAGGPLACFEALPTYVTPFSMVHRLYGLKVSTALVHRCCLWLSWRTTTKSKKTRAGFYTQSPIWEMWVLFCFNRRKRQGHFWNVRLVYQVMFQCIVTVFTWLIVKSLICLITLRMKCGWHFPPVR